MLLNCIQYIENKLMILILTFVLFTTTLVLNLHVNTRLGQIKKRLHIEVRTFSQHSDISGFVDN